MSKAHISNTGPTSQPTNSAITQTHHRPNCLLSPIHTLPHALGPTRPKFHARPDTKAQLLTAQQAQPSAQPTRPASLDQQYQSAPSPLTSPLNLVYANHPVVPRALHLVTTRLVPSPATLSLQ